MSDTKLDDSRFITEFVTLAVTYNNASSFGGSLSNDCYIELCRALYLFRDAHRKDAVSEAREEISTLRAAAEKARELAEDIGNWSKAYPTTVFPEPSPEKVDAVCKTLGFSLDSISAMVLRAFTKPWGDRAKSALAALEEVLK